MSKVILPSNFRFGLVLLLSSTAIIGSGGEQVRKRQIWNYGSIYIRSVCKSGRGGCYEDRGGECNEPKFQYWQNATYHHTS